MKINITLPFSDEERGIIRCGLSKLYGEPKQGGKASRQEIIIFIQSAISDYMTTMQDACNDNSY